MVGIAAVTAATVSCSAGGGGTGERAVVSGGTLTLAVPVDLGSLDPHKSATNANAVASTLAYDTPLSLDSKNEPVPGVVTAWRNEPGSGAWVLTVRPGVTCSDGSPLDAKTVADNINYVANPENGSPFTGLAVQAGTTAVGDVAAGSVAVTSSSPAPFFIQNLSLLQLVCAPGLANRDLLTSGSSGSGAYVVSQNVPGDHVTFTLRKGYSWGPADHPGTDVEGIPETVVVKTVTDPTTTANLLLNGQLNAASVVGSEQKRLKGAGLFSAGPSNLNDELVFNQAAGNPGADVDVRRALVMALDLGQLSAVNSGGLGGPAAGLLPVPRICPGDVMTGSTPAHDTGQAKALLDRSGWAVGPDGVRAKGGARLTLSLLHLSNQPQTSASAEYIASRWKEVGVEVTLDQRPSDQVASGLLGGTVSWGAALIIINVSTPAALAPFFSGTTPPNGQNFAAIANDRYRSLSEQAVVKTGTEGCADWNAAEAALIGSADVTPLSMSPNLWWGKNATFAVNDATNTIVPTSMRLLAP
ncbi:ABC transporter substrate-binding protein [Umezawaea endophytica]|uniref:ABC transporter substrate-binding protein n=1 Tax=Umezawaea endophytica TaxID=1654476 RepID=UPI0023E040B3